LQPRLPLEDKKLGPLPRQDIQDRLWDVLWMLKAVIRRIQAHRSILHFSLRVVPNVPTNYAKPNPPRPKLMHLKAVCRPDDDGSPCLTIILAWTLPIWSPDGSKFTFQHRGLQEASIWIVDAKVLGSLKTNIEPASAQPPSKPASSAPPKTAPATAPSTR
jgi:hypothetical protein